MNLEKLLIDLDDVVKKIQEQETTLDESLALFNKGVELSKECIDILDNAKCKINVLNTKLKEITKKEIDFDDEGNIKEL